MTDQKNTSVGRVYLPGNPGQPVGKFQFLVTNEANSAGDALEVGAFVTVDTAEGKVVGTVTDMHAIGSISDPLAADLQPRTDVPNLVTIPEATLATAQVLASERLRPIRSGVVRFSTADEVEKALGQDKIRWKIPVGTVKLGTGELLPLCLDGDFTTGPEAAGVLVTGKSGLASKTSAQTVLAKSMICSAKKMGESIAILFVNVKGTDLLALDKPPAASKALNEDDLAMYEAMGVDPTPFENVTVYAPSQPGGTEPNSFRDDARLVRWDLPMIWPYMNQMFNVEDNLRNLLADMRAELVEHPNPVKRYDTIMKLDAWFQNIFDAYEDTTAERKGSAWKSHHIATLRRAHKLITSLVPRFGGLVSRESTNAEYDIPTTGWFNGQVVVLDIASLAPDIQGITLARTISRMFDSAEAGELGVDRLTVVFDELNKFAPASGGAEFSGVKKTIRDVYARGRYAGISAISACQKASRVDPEVVENASTKLLGMSSYEEVTSGVYGSKLAAGLIEQIETAPKGSMAVFHHLFRQAVSSCQFPRPAWHTGKLDPKIAKRKKPADTLKLSSKSLENLTEGLDQDAVNTVIANSDDPQQAIKELRAIRVPDLRTRDLHTAKIVDDDSDPFGLGSM